MELKVRKIGNGFGVLLPKQLLEEMFLEEGALTEVDKWTCSEVKETGIFLLATVGEISEAEFTAWVERSIVPK